MSITCEPRAEEANGERPAASPANTARRAPRLVLASILLSAPGWLSWVVTGQGLISPVITSIILAANMILTWWFPSVKLHLVKTIQRYLLNPLIRLLLSLGVLPLGLALLETRGRRSGKPRRTPVGEGLEGPTFWIVAEHGRQANYVQNIQANPRVRVKVRRGLWPTWCNGIATILDDDDPHARQRQLCRRHPLRAINATLVRAWGIDLVTIRIDLANEPSR